MTNGGIGTIGGAPVAVMDGALGPAVKFAANPDSIGIPGKSTMSYATNTLAVIFRINTVTSTQAFLSTGTSGTDLNFLATTTNGANNFLTVSRQGLATAGNLVAAPVGGPYFFAASENQVAGTSAINWVGADLATGQITSGSTSIGSWSLGIRNGTFNIGSRGAGNLFGLSNISAAMISNQFLSISVLRQWATDPWSLWYRK
jgi:hypothetical protein